MDAKMQKRVHARQSRASRSSSASRGPRACFGTSSAAQRAPAPQRCSPAGRPNDTVHIMFKWCFTDGQSHAGRPSLVDEHVYHRHHSSHGARTQGIKPVSQYLACVRAQRAHVNTDTSRTPKSTHKVHTASAQTQSSRKQVRLRLSLAKPTLKNFARPGRPTLSRSKYAYMAWYT